VERAWRRALYTPSSPFYVREGRTIADNQLKGAMEKIRSVTSAPDEKAYAYTLIDVTTRTHETLASAGEARGIKRLKVKKILTGEERVAERLVYSRCFDSISERGGNSIVDGLLSALEDRRVEVNIIATDKAQTTSKLKAHKPRPNRPD
jgi:hypothetical protein